jgi:hypothetical protein
MRIVKLSGGLGNQMFQYVFGQYISKKYKEKIYYDCEWYKNQKSNKKTSTRNLELLKFDLDIEILKNRKYLFKSNLIDTLLYLIKNLLLYSSNRNTIYESRVSLLGRFLSAIFGKKYNIGYWQKYKYYESISKDIEFKLKDNQLFINSRIKEKILDTNAVSIGVRRGDYVRLGLITCDIAYYKKAINLIAKNINNPIFYIFSDDIEWCKKNIKIPNKHYFVESNQDTPFENMELMSLCKHNIISNSSYDWWGAVLNKNNQKTVICPKIWMPNNLEIAKSLIPNEWTKI